MTDSRTALLLAAAQEFARYGLKGTRVQSIVQRAGVNERMIYHHFGSKEGLYLAVVTELRQAAGTHWQPVLEAAAAMPPYEGMKHALAGFYDLTIAHPALPAMLAHELLAGAWVAPFPSASELPAGLREIYEAGQREGVFAGDRPFEIAYMTTIGALVGLAAFAPRFTAALPAGLVPDQASLRDQIVGQLVDGLTGPASHPTTGPPPT